MISSDEDATKSSNPTTAKVVIISSVMFVFLSYWRVAAVVLCDLASTAYYIGGIVEHSIGPVAPWFIVGVMFFSYAVRSRNRIIDAIGETACLLEQTFQ